MTADIDLRTTATTVFNTILGKPVTEHLELDRVHFVMKEEILKKAATMGLINFDGA